MKRIAALFIALMLVFGFVSCSCGGDASDVETKTDFGGEYTKFY